MLTALALAALLQEPDLDRRISIDKRGTLQQLLDAVRSASGIGIVVDPRTPARVDVERTVELKLKDVKVRSALRWATRLYGLEFAVQDGTVVVGAPGQLEAGVLTKALDVAGVLARPQDNPAPREGQPEFIPPHESGPSSSPEEELIDLIRSVVAPGTWGGAMAVKSLQPGHLSVTHHPGVVAEVERLVAALRSLKPATMTIDAELFELDADGERFFDAMAPAAMGEAESKKTHDALKGARAAKAAQAFQLACTECQLSHMTYKRGGRAYTIEARPALRPDGASKVDLAFDAPGLRLRTTTVVPARGSCVFLLPRAERTVALLVRVAVSGAAPREADLRPAEAAGAPADGPAGDYDYREAPWSKVVEDLRGRLRRNVVLDPALAERPLSLQATGVKPLALLRLAGVPAAEADEALYIGHARLSTELHLASVRDLALAPRDFGADVLRSDPASFEPRAVLDRLRENVQRERWQESLDTVARHTSNGLVVLRHAPDVLQESRAHMAEMRRLEGTVATVRTDVVAVPAKACDELVGADSLVDAAAAAKLLAAGTGATERLQLNGLSGLRVGLVWDRRDQRSTLDVKSDATAEGVQAALRFDLQDADGDKPWHAAARSTVTVPAGKAAVLKLGLVEGAERTYRLLILRAR